MHLAGLHDVQTTDQHHLAYLQNKAHGVLSVHLLPAVASAAHNQAKQALTFACFCLLLAVDLGS
jgi:hypothetical protein